jgi:shikimate 5-dehydrogenase/shikimate kinase
MAGVKRPFTALSAEDDAGKQPVAANCVAAAQSQSVTPPDRIASPAFEPLSGKSPNIEKDATIVLVGVRGSGKSTLAVFASAALKRNVIDMDMAFQRVHGMTASSYKKEHGADECQKQQADILRDALENNDKGRILVCSWMDRQVQVLLRAFANWNPVVHVIRDMAAIKSHLKITEDQKVQTLTRVATTFFRTCTNFEFFNVSEKGAGQSPAGGEGSSSIPSLTLKHAEKHFLKFLSLLYPVGTIPFVESAFPLARIPPEQRQFTYVVSLALCDILSEVDLEDACCGADAVQITVPISTNGYQSPTSADDRPTAANITKAVGAIRRATVLPILCHLTLREVPSAEEWHLYKDLLSHALKLAPESVTVDLRLDSDEICKLLAGRRRSNIVGCREMGTFAEPWGSQYWKSLYDKARVSSCDTVRFIRPAASIDENFAVTNLRAVLSAREGQRLPVSAYNSGPIGRPSACFNPLLTVVSTKAVNDIEASSNIHPSITACQATKSLFASFVYDAMKLYVFGANVDYSMSPLMHNSAFAAHGIPHEYRPYSCSSLSGIRHLIEDPYFGGASIGLPFKVEVITLTHSLSRHARAIGAVNTLIPIRKLNGDNSVPTEAAFFKNVNRAGKVLAFYGENTDWIGIKACIQRGLSPANAVRSTSCGVIIGAGGMARAAVYAMLQVGVRNIVIYNRTPENAHKVATHFQNLFEKGPELFGNGTEIRFHIMESREAPWPLDFRHPTILISCVPTHQIGDEPAPNFTAPESWLASPTGGVIFELGYKTLNTPLLQQARNAASRGWVAMDGLDLLPEQGFAQFELFTGRRAPRALMRKELFKNYRDEEGHTNLPELQRRLEAMTDQGV